jgi:tripartite-type tricarboxylate transporter receptor subunit TctC
MRMAGQGAALCAAPITVHARGNFMRCRSQILLTLLALAATTLPAAADDYPSRPIRAIASQGPGGLSDLFMRALGDQMGPALNTSIVVEDRVGAEGTIGAKSCADAAPDGYTICILPGEAIVINPIIQPSDFDPAQRLTPVARPYYLTQMFAVSASLNIKSFADLAAQAKAKPFNYMAPSLSKVAFMEGFNKQNGTDIVRIPFKGGGDAVTAMLTGTAQIAIFGIGNLISFIQDGKITGLAIDGDQRSPLAPEIPTFKEVGYKDHIAATFFGIFAPAGTPKPIVDRLNKELRALIDSPEVRARIASDGGDPLPSSPEEYAADIQREDAKWGALIRKLKLKVE